MTRLSHSFSGCSARQGGVTPSPHVGSRAGGVGGRRRRNFGQRGPGGHSLSRPVGYLGRRTELDVRRRGVEGGIEHDPAPVVDPVAQCPDTPGGEIELGAQRLRSRIGGHCVDAGRLHVEIRGVDEVAVDDRLRLVPLELRDCVTGLDELRQRNVDGAFEIGEVQRSGLELLRLGEKDLDGLGEGLEGRVDLRLEARRGLWRRGACRPLLNAATRPMRAAATISGTTTAAATLSPWFDGGRTADP